MAPTPDVIDLGIGEPDGALAPLAELAHAASHRLSLKDVSWFPYGPEQGPASFREVLAAFLTRHYGTIARPEELLVTAGASHGLDLVLSCFTKPGDTVFVEDPTYFFGLDVIRERHVRIVPIATDEQGLDITALERELERCVPKLLYTIPVFHNPTGTTMPADRRRRLAELAARFEFLVVADEVYQLVGLPERVPSPLREFSEDRVLSLGSFSKILAPGVRLGWIQGSPDHLSALSSTGVLRSGGGVNPVMVSIIESGITLGLQDRHLERMREAYEHRRQHVLRVLDAVLDDSVHFTRPGGGFYVWLTLAGPVDTTVLAEAGRRQGIGFRPGEIFSAEGGFRNCLRLCFVYYGEDALSLGCERLATLLRSTAGSGNPRGTGRPSAARNEGRQ